MKQYVGIHTILQLYGCNIVMHITLRLHIEYSNVVILLPATSGSTHGVQHSARGERASEVKGKMALRAIFDFTAVTNVLVAAHLLGITGDL